MKELTLKEAITFRDEAKTSPDEGSNVFEAVLTQLIKYMELNSNKVVQFNCVMSESGNRRYTALKADGTMWITTIGGAWKQIEHPE